MVLFQKKSLRRVFFQVWCVVSGVGSRIHSLDASTWVKVYGIIPCWRSALFVMKSRPDSIPHQNLNSYSICTLADRAPNMAKRTSFDFRRSSKPLHTSTATKASTEGDNRESRALGNIRVLRNLRKSRYFSMVVWPRFGPLLKVGTYFCPLLL